MKSRILFLLSHQPNPRFVKQISFLSVRSEVSVFYFFRKSLKDLSQEYCGSIDMSCNLGGVVDGVYLQRMGVYLKSLVRLRQLLRRSNSDYLVVNNIDMLLLFKACQLFGGRKVRIIMEISDLRQHSYTDTIRSRFVKVVERYAFKYVERLIVTSPKFYSVYYKSLFSKEYFVLENKPLSTMVPKKIEGDVRDKVTIGIVGMLLQGGPYETLLELVKGSDVYEVHVYGKGEYVGMIEEYASAFENISYFGGYNFFKDISRIYAGLDILYMPYDTTNGSLNNKVALPNKLYEAMHFCVPIITSGGTYLGELVTQYGIGLTVKCCDATSLNESLGRMVNDIDAFRRKAEELPKNSYLADDDYKKLEKYILE